MLGFWAARCEILRLTKEAGADVAEVATAAVGALREKLGHAAGISVGEGNGILELITSSVLPGPLKREAAELVSKKVMVKGSQETGGPKMQQPDFV